MACEIGGLRETAMLWILRKEFARGASQQDSCSHLLAPCICQALRSIAGEVTGERDLWVWKIENYSRY